MQRPDLTTLACINADCPQFARPGQGNLTIRKVYGQDGIRLLRCRSCLRNSRSGATQPCSTPK